jgi:hypothetical protein
MYWLLNALAVGESAEIASGAVLRGLALYLDGVPVVSR